MPQQGSYVAGSWIVPTGAEIREDINPSNLADVVGRFVRSPASLVDDAVDAARQAQRGWARTSPQTRADLLEKVAAAILADSAALGELLAREEGKTRAEAIGEVVRAGQIFRFFSGEALRMTGERQDSTREGVSVTIHREPVGVVGIVTPWNFPIAIPAWKVAPALAFGNTVIFKPAELVPASASALATLIDRAGFPSGVFNMVIGSGGVVGEALVTHPGVDAVTFTGSETVGQHVAVSGAERFSKVQLEMGGKNPLVIAADADLDIAVDIAVNGSYFATGQRCTASSRLIVVDSIHDAFVDGVLARIAALRVGDALADDTEIGPVVDRSQLDTDLAYLEIARALPHAEVHGGELLERATDGFYLSPALITGTANKDRVNQEEMFGPIATVIRADDYDHAVELANDTPFGLASGICTTSLRLAEDFQSRSDAGMVMVNLPTAGVDPHVPFGGRKRSSYGPKEQGAHARLFFTQTKTAYVRP